MPMPETTTFQYDDYNKLTEITFPDSTTETLSYDDNGQLVRREKSTGETTEYEWNDQGMLVKVILPNGEPVEYEYDGNQRLISRKSSDGVDNFVQSGWDIITKTDDVGKRTYYTGSSAVESEESAKYFHYNHRGDTVLVTDSEGNTLNNFSYEAYGKVTNSEGIPVNSLTVKDIPNLFVGASGIRYDTKTNLHYMRFRWFSVSQLRFISPDLLMDLNRYAYVSGNPVSFIDPLGLYFVYRADNQEEADAINYMISLSYTYGSPEIQYMINKLEESGIPIVIDFEWGMNNKMETQWDRNGKYLTISINKNIYCNPTLADKQITDISGTFVQEVYHLWLDILRKEKPGLIPDDEKVMGTEETYAHLIEGFFYVKLPPDFFSSYGRHEFPERYMKIIRKLRGKKNLHNIHYEFIKPLMFELKKNPYYQNMRYPDVKLPIPENKAKFIRPRTCKPGLEPLHRKKSKGKNMIK